MTLEEQSAIRTVLYGFEHGIFVRDTSRDHEPGWIFGLAPYIAALAVLQRALNREVDVSAHDMIEEARYREVEEHAG